MTYLQPLDTTTSVQHRFASDLYGQGVDVCSDCGRGRDDRDHMPTAPTYVDAIEEQATGVAVDVPVWHGRPWFPASVATLEVVCDADARVTGAGDARHAAGRVLVGVPVIR